MRRCLVTGAAGFIGWHLCKRLQKDGHWVRGIDRRKPEYGLVSCAEFDIWDLSRIEPTSHFFEFIDDVYHLARADDVLVSSRSDICVYDACRVHGLTNVIVPSDALQAPFGKCVQFGNVFGPGAPYRGEEANVISRLCAVVAVTAHGETVEVSGTGEEVLSFVYVDDACEALIRIAAFDQTETVQVYSRRTITMSDLVNQIIAISKKWIAPKFTGFPIAWRHPTTVVEISGQYVPPTKQQLGWEPVYPLELGLLHTYQWVQRQVARQRNAPDLTVS